MEDGLLSLKWNNHRTTFFHILSNLRKKQTYTDATIACEGKFFPVHKLVMSTCSDYFSEIFDKTPCKAPVVVLKDIRHPDLEALLDYMYLGEVDVKQSELAGLIKAAECLRIKGLAVPDEDPNTAKKSSHVPEKQSTPPSKRRRRTSDYEDSYSNKSSRLHSPSRSHSSSSTSVPSHPPSSDTLSQMPSYHSQRHTSGPSKNDNEPEVVAVDMIKVEVEDEPEHAPQDDSLLLDHSSADDPGDDPGDLDGDGINNLGDKKDLSNSYSDYGDPSRDIEKEEMDQMEDPYSESDTLPGPSGVQGGSSMSQWGEDEGSFPHNLFGNEDSQQQSQQQVYPPIGESFSISSLDGHQPRKRHICDYCQRCFVHITHLKDHLRIHTGDKPFKCQHCDYEGRVKYSLHQHILRYHLDKCYSCPKCGYALASQGQYNHHMQTKHQ